jgi:hypothetical protein
MDKGDANLATELGLAMGTLADNTKSCRVALCLGGELTTLASGHGCGRREVRRRTG